MKRGAVLLLGWVCCGSTILRGDDTADAKLIAAANAGPVKNVGLEEFEKIRAAKKSVVIDFRTPGEYATAHIPGAINIDSHSRSFAETVAALDKQHTYLVHGTGVSNSTNALERMARLKFTNVYHLEGGFKVWRDAGKPLEKLSAEANNGSAE